MRRLNTRLDGSILLAPAVHGDERGFFHESYRRTAMAELGIEEEFVQDNHSRSVHGVLRGMHFMVGSGTSKLVRCGRGSIYDVLVDIRRASSTFGEWEGFELSEENLHMLYVPVGFAHGFCVTSDVADVLYKQSAYFDPELEREIAYDDPDVGIEWPAVDLIVSERDKVAPRLAEVADELPF